VRGQKSTKIHIIIKIFVRTMLSQKLSILSRKTAIRIIPTQIQYILRFLKLKSNTWARLYPRSRTESMIIGLWQRKENLFTVTNNLLLLMGWLSSTKIPKIAGCLILLVWSKKKTLLS
jgi:hypothetical protein